MIIRDARNDILTFFFFNFFFFWGGERVLVGSLNPSVSKCALQYYYTLSVSGALETAYCVYILFVFFFFFISRSYSSRAFFILVYRSLKHKNVIITSGYSKITHFVRFNRGGGERAFYM